MEQPNLASDPRFKDNPDRYKNRNELDTLVNEKFCKFEVAEIMSWLDEAGIANAALNSVAELSNHPFLRNTEATYNGMSISMAGLPVPDLNGEPITVPQLDQQSDAIRQEFTGA